MSDEVVYSCQADNAPPELVKRNFQLGVLNGVFFVVGEALLDPTLVLVAFVSQLSQSALLIGLVLPLRDSLWAIPQLWMTSYIQSLAHKIDLCRKITIVRIICWICLALEINFISNYNWLLISFFVTYGLASLASGLNGLAFMEIISKTIPSRRRGEFFAWRLGISGGFNIASSFLVRWLLSSQTPLTFPHNFGLLSILYMVLASTGLIFFNRIDEPPDENPLPAQPFNILLKRALIFLKQDIPYRNFITLLSLMNIATMATPFFAVYVQQSLGGDPSMVGIYLGVTIASNLVSNLAFGRISKSLGNQRVLMWSVIAGIIMSSNVFLLTTLAKPWHISAQMASLWLIPVFIFSGIRTTGYSISSTSIILDIAPASDRSLYVGFLNTLTGFVLLLCGLSGVIKDLLGIQVLVLLTLLAHIASLFLTLKIKKNRSA